MTIWSREISLVFLVDDDGGGKGGGGRASMFQQILLSNEEEMDVEIKMKVLINLF